MTDSPPTLILTARFDAVAQTFFEAARKAHFPADRNFIPAHLTLFHQLPGEHLTETVAAVRSVTSTITAPIAARCSAVQPLGNGGAFTIEAPALWTVREQIATTFSDQLSVQDRQKSQRRPGWHVTFQNKVDRETAVRTLETVRAAFEPFETTIIALELWTYRGGPWGHAATLPIGPSGP